jgi:hypothetical protein
VRLEVLSVWILLDRYVHSTRYEDEADLQDDRVSSLSQECILHSTKPTYPSSSSYCHLPTTFTIILEHTMSYDFHSYTSFKSS